MSSENREESIEEKRSTLGGTYRNTNSKAWLQILGLEIWVSGNKSMLFTMNFWTDQKQPHEISQ